MIETENSQVYFGSNLDVLPTLPDNSVDSIVTDPPYELGFMGKSWDSSGIAYNVELWKECLRVLKPGGHLLAFSGSRTYHRMTVAIEDAGFEVRDMIAWISNKTFPKSLDISKAIDNKRDQNPESIKVADYLLAHNKFGTISKFREYLNENILGKKHSGGSAQEWTTTDLTAKKINRCPSWSQWLDIKKLLNLDDSMDAYVWRLNGLKGQPSENFKNRRKIGERDVPKGHSFASEKYGKEKGNHTVAETESHTPEARKWEGWGTALKPTVEPIVMARKPLIGTVAKNVLEHGTGGLNIHRSRIGAEGRWPSNAIIDKATAENLDENARFFYVPRASKTDRSEGLETENNHPTVKPTDLMTYLVNLVTPPNGTVLDPFTGSGSTGKAAILAGFNFVGIELTENFHPIIEGRLKHAETKKQHINDDKEEQLF